MNAKPLMFGLLGALAAFAALAKDRPKGQHRHSRKVHMAGAPLAQA